jgi:SAM-dependent methyltransferase
VDDRYAVDAAYYDLVHAGAPDDDVGLWLSFAGRTSRPILEVGTGTGRIALELAAMGYRLTALDPSEAMLRVARAGAGARGIAVTFIHGLPADATLPDDEFGLVLLPADVFLYCADGEEQLATLRALAAAMHFDAKLILDLPGPAAWLDPSLNGQPILAWSGEGPDGSPLEAWHLRDDDLAAQVRLLSVRYETLSPGGAVRREVSLHRLRYVYRFEAEYLLALSGLRLEDVYGDYDLGPLTGDSERMIVVARRAAG